MTRAARVRVGARVLVALPDVGPEVARELRELCSHTNPQYQKLKNMGIRFDHKKEPRIIETWRDEGAWLSLPRGAMRRVRELLKRQGFKLLVKDERTEGYLPILEGFKWPAYKRTLFPDQEEAVEAMLLKETCYLRSATGSGKTESGLAVIARVMLPAIVLVWTGALLDQWRERIQQALGIEEHQIGIVQGTKKTIGPITIAMQQTVAKMKPDDPFFGFFGVFIFDELQRAAAMTAYAATDSFAARYRIGMSAHETRADHKEAIIYDLFGDMALEIKRLDLVSNGRVRDVEVRVIPTGWRLPEEALVGNSGAQHRKMLEAMTFAEDRDEIALGIVVMELKREEQILIFSLRVEHCRRLVGELASAGISAGLMLGGAENRAELKDAVEGMRAGRMRVAVGTVQAVGTGVDLPSVGVGIVMMPIASNRQLFGQVAGRVCRVAGGAGAARLYYLGDPCRARDWTALFDDERPVYVRDDDGSWIDAREEKKRARRVAFPEESGIFNFSRGDAKTWRTR
jgi:superfamily II DNA or RNA helicase